MLAVVAEDVEGIALRQRPEPGDPGPGQVLLRPEAVGICGSDFHFIAGELSEQAGGSQFPRVLGHEVAARIVALGPDCRPELEPGQRVALYPLLACGHCYPCRVDRPNACDNFSLIGIHSDGGLQELLATAQDQVVPIAAEDPGVAAMAEPVSIAVRAINRAQLEPGERVVVLGAGPIGQSLCLVAVERGAQVLMVDLQEPRLKLGELLGADTLVWRGVEETVSRARDWAGEAGPPVAIDATGAGDAVRAMIEMVASAGRAIQVGMSGEEVALRIGNLTEKELDIRGVSCANADEFREAVSVVERNARSVARMISHRFALSEGPDALRFAMENPNRVMKVVIGE
ncbi:MAG TPA: alcohol dehydrogenase catalytic domain-containing protein [Solirubrobacteraceae bacterium]|nr:alcohol dehydrogenase catalytic domain-containing protein [Solirubrobacteraceae bacterium]